MRNACRQALRSVRVISALALLVTGAAALEAAGPGSLEMGFAPEVSSGTGLWRLAEQPDGKLLIGGSFNLIGGERRGYVARLNADWSLDPAFNLGAGANITVLALALQPDGKVLIVGQFDEVHGVPRSFVARLNADGTLDSGFGAAGGPDDVVADLAVQPDGKIVVVGSFQNVGGVPRNRVARLNADGTLDAGFDPGNGADAFVRALALQADGKVVIGGDFQNVNGLVRGRIARLNANGSVDTGFDPGFGANRLVRVVAVQADGRILLGGQFSSVGGVSQTGLARLNVDGSLDASFGSGAPPFPPSVSTLAVQPDGKVVVGGSVTLTGQPGQTSGLLRRVNADGSYDAGFPWDGGPTGSVTTSLVRADGRIVVGGGFTAIGGLAREKVARLASDFSVDTTIAPSSTMRYAGQVESLAIQPDGKVLTGGYFGLVNGTARRSIMRLNADGTPDSGFDTGEGASSSVLAMAPQPDGKTVLGGYFTSVDGQPRGAVARLHKSGAVDSFGGIVLENAIMVQALALQTDGRVVIGGPFDTINGYSRLHVARLTNKGGLDYTFTATVGTNDDDVTAIALQPDGKVLIGGTFTTIDGTDRNRIGRLTAEGALDTSFDPGAGVDGRIRAMSVQPDGKVLIVGDFTNAGGLARSRIARLNADGAVDTSFDPGSGANDSVWAMALQPDGQVVIGGSFATIDGTSRRGVARLNADGTLDSSFDPGTGLEGDVYSLALQPDGKIVVGGGFTSFDGTRRIGMARLYGSTSPFPVGLEVDRSEPPSGTSNINGVLEPGESVVLEPSWRNPTANPQLVTGTLGPVSGPGESGFTLLDAASSYGTLAVDASASCLGGGSDCFALRLDAPASRPVAHWDVNVTETANGDTPKTWTLHVGDSFADVPRDYWAYRQIETAFHGRVTSGCGTAPLRYCPGSTLTRAEMAVLLLRADHGSEWVPPASTGTVFADVPIDHWAGDFIEQLAAEEITAGCGAERFCPDAPISRAEAAVLLLIAEHGAGWVPPESTGNVFSDVPIDHWAGDFIEQLAAEGITAGCAVEAYCPDGIVTRAEMAVFLTATFRPEPYH